MQQLVNDRYADVPGMSLSARDQYEREVSWIETEPLSSEDEKKYLDRIRRARLDPSHGWLQNLAKDARERLAEHYQPSIRRLVQAYVKGNAALRKMDFLDLVQEANIALLDAFDTYPFDEDRGAFVSWMAGCVRMALKSLYVQAEGGIRLNTKVWQWVADIRAAENDFWCECGRLPSYDDLVSRLGCSRSRLYELLCYRGMWKLASIEAICDRYEMPEDHYKFVEMYESGSDEDRTRADGAAARIEEAFSQLSPRRRSVLRLCYGLGGESKHTAAEVGDLLGVQQRTVESTVTQAKRCVRTLLAPLYEDQEMSA